ncbi:MAG TPA: serine hydrolase domain-containing protein [Magnetospirillaceae bacterium]|jgi:CubicO group peptidase (beta-lactamase class C family)
MTPRDQVTPSSVFEQPDPVTLGFHPPAFERLCRVIAAHVEEGRYPGAQIAFARRGKIAFTRSFGSARLAPKPVAADDETLWLLYSNTKVIVAAAIWILVEEGALTFHDRVTDHIPDFARYGKGEITLFQLLTHQAGFPAAGMDIRPSVWQDHDEMRRLICDFQLEWTPGSRVEYHRLAAHWTLAMVIEAVTKIDYRKFLRERIIDPLGLGHELFVGVPDSEMPRVADMYTSPGPGQAHTPLGAENSAEFRRAGSPGSGGYASARAMAMFYQALVNGGSLNGVRLLSPRLIQYVIRNFTGDRVDVHIGAPMHRGMGVQTRGHSADIRGPGTLASPSTFGHGGVESSFCLGDPESGMSFAYITNGRAPNPWHSRRLDIVCSMAAAALQELR